MTEPEMFIFANHTLRPIIDQIKDDQWDQPAPDIASWTPGQSLRDIVNYHAFDDICVPEVLAGLSKDQYMAKHPIDKDLLDGDPKGNYAKYNQLACEAAGAAKDLDQTAHLSYGDFPAREYLQHITLFRSLRCYDIAKFIGAGTELPAEMVDWLWSYLHDNEAMLRQNRVINDPVDVPGDAPLQDRALAFTGRQP
jgi:uncharacterized protein (TIGR03086 family)